MVESIYKRITFTFLLAVALVTLIVLPMQYAKAATYTDPLTGKMIQYPDAWTPVQSQMAQLAQPITHGNLVLFDDSNGIPMAMFGSIPASDPNSIANNVMSVVGQGFSTQLLNPKNVTLASGKPALQFEFYYQSQTIHPNGDLGDTFTPTGNQIHIGGIAIIEGGILYAVDYFPDSAQNNPDYMKQILDMANSL